MAQNYTPLPPSLDRSSAKHSFPKLPVIGGMLVLGLLVAIAGGVFLVNRVQNQTTKAVSFDACIGAGAGAFEWRCSCPINTTQIGTIDTQVGGGGDSGSTGSGTGASCDTIPVCCKPNTPDVPTGSVTGVPNVPIPTATVTPPPPDSRIFCKLPTPVLEITCPNGCE